MKILIAKWECFKKIVRPVNSNAIRVDGFVWIYGYGDIPVIEFEFYGDATIHHRVDRYFGVNKRVSINEVASLIDAFAADG